MIVARVFFSMLAVTFCVPAWATGENAQLDALAALLQDCEAILVAGGWPSIAEGPSIRPGDSDPRLEALALRLAISRDLPDDAEPDPDVYGGALLSAVKRFQRRHGLATDGIVGPMTIAALNVPVEDRIDQVRVNIHRAASSQLPDVHNFVRVNIPAFRADIVRDNRAEWTTRVIVGEDCTQTPVLNASIKSIVINPTWTVPHRIATEELLPKIKADAEYLARGKYELRAADGTSVVPASIDWTRISRSNFPFTIVQRPGPLTQLGRIKFAIPNEYDVFMHDTPARYLFEKPVRAFSHGCIRVDEPLRLAERILSGTEWTSGGLLRVINAGKMTTIALPEPMPVNVVYRTVEVDDAATAYFYNDVYERDAAILSAIDET